MVGTMVGSVGRVTVAAGCVVVSVGAVVGKVIGCVRGGKPVVGMEVPTVVTVLTEGPKVVTVEELPVVPEDCTVLDVGPCPAVEQAAIPMQSMAIVQTNIHFLTKTPPFLFFGISGTL